MLTKQDKEYLDEKFATKEDLNKSENRVIQVVEDVGNMIMKEFKSEINDLREEIGDTLEDHERRLDRLEEKVLS